MITSIERTTGPRWLALFALVLLVGCGGPQPQESAGDATESWSVTAWGERFEVFPEVEVLVAGRTSVAHTHVTRLSDFAAVVEARVEIVLAGPDGEQVFGAQTPSRPGIFAIDVRPSQTGEADLLFRIHDSEGTEEIRGGRVRVGTIESPGSLLRAPAPRGASDGGEALSFLKEQQWKSGFATNWVREGRLARSVSGLATLRPPAGGESTVTSPIAGVVQPPGPRERWPFVGLRVDRGATLFRVAPLVAPERSLAALKAELSTLATELESSRARLAGLRELLALDATSGREVEEARVRVDVLEARHLAASGDLDDARAARQGGTSGRGVQLKAPFAGGIAAVHAAPGSTVSAGERLARLVRTDRVWVEVSVPPEGARRLASQGVGGLVLEDPERAPVRVADGLSLISIAPEISPRSGTITVLLEAPSELLGFALGSTVAAQVLSTEERPGIVVPTTALVDDGGTTVVYLQLSGESFVRQEVAVLERQGAQALVDHLIPGQRLVTAGGNAIRRASLMASGEAQGHVH